MCRRAWSQNHGNHHGNVGAQDLLGAAAWLLPEIAAPSTAEARSTRFIRDGYDNSSDDVLNHVQRGRAGGQQGSEPRPGRAVVAEFLGAHRPVDRVSIRLLVPDEHALLVVAVWSRSPTTITPGLRMSKAASSLPEVLVANAPVVVEEASRAQLLDDVLTSEGIRSWVTAPLREGSQIGALR